MPALASHSENWPEPSHGFAYHPGAERILILFGPFRPTECPVMC